MMVGAKCAICGRNLGYEVDSNEVCFCCSEHYQSSEMWDFVKEKGLFVKVVDGNCYHFFKQKLW